MSRTVILFAVILGAFPPQQTSAQPAAAHDVATACRRDSFYVNAHPFICMRQRAIEQRQAENTPTVLTFRQMNPDQRREYRSECIRNPTTECNRQMVDYYGRIVPRTADIINNTVQDIEHPRRGIANMIPRAPRYSRRDD
jgi:hypothetical protein